MALTPRRRPRAPRHPRRAAARRRVGLVTLLAGGLVGLAAGVGTGAVLVPPSAPPVAPAVVAGAEEPSTPSPSPGPEPATVTPDDDALAAAGAVQDLTPPPEILAAPPEAPEPLEPQVLPPDDGLTAADRAAGLLGLEVPEQGSGELLVVPGSEAAPAPDRPVRTVRVEVEAGLPIDGTRFAETVMTTLNDPRGWGADGSVSFARTDGEADVRVVLASPGTVDAMCAPLETVGLYSCGRYGHAAINHMRWVQGTEEFPELTVYRQYVVNHEVGHLLGNPHEECPGAGELAPLMQQQTVGVAPCVPNPWPHPTP